MSIHLDPKPRPAYSVLVRELPLEIATCEQGALGLLVGGHQCEVLTYAEEGQLVATESAYGNASAVAHALVERWALRGHRVRWHPLETPKSPTCGATSGVRDVAIYIDQPHHDRTAAA